MSTRLSKLRRSDWDTTAKSRQTFGRFQVGQEVTVTSSRRCFTGIIRRLVVPNFGWQFAVVEDETGGHHACDFDELS